MRNGIDTEEKQGTRSNNDPSPAAPRSSMLAEGFGTGGRRAGVRGKDIKNLITFDASRRLFRIVDVDVAVEGMMTFSSPVSHNLPSSERGAAPGVVFAPRKLRAKTSRCHRYRRRNRPGTAAPRSEGGSFPPAPLK